MRLPDPLRRTIFALHRSFWDARDSVGDHALFAALSAVTLVVLTVVFVSRGDAVSALYGLGAVWLVFLVFVLFKFAQALAHPDQHGAWEWVDYGIQEEAWRVEVRSLAPLRAGSWHPGMKPLLCRIIAPDKRLWLSLPSMGGRWPGGPNSRDYPSDFRCEKCRQPPPRILPGQYEITWLEPWRGSFRRPLLLYTQQAPEFEQAPESGEQAS